MPAYWVAMVEITDMNRYREYIRLAPIALAKYGGKICARGGETVFLEGKDTRHRVAILEFPDTEAAIAYYNSPEYAEARSHRMGASKVEFLFITEGIVMGAPAPQPR